MGQRSMMLPEAYGREVQVRPMFHQSHADHRRVLHMI